MTTEFFYAAGISPGLLIRLERVRRGWRQCDLAQKAGVTQAEVSSLERNLYIVPIVRQRIFHALELDIEEAKHE